MKRRFPKGIAYGSYSEPHNPMSRRLEALSSTHRRVTPFTSQLRIPGSSQDKDSRRIPDLPSDILFEIAILLQLRDKAAMACVSWKYHDAIVPVLYRRVSVYCPSFVISRSTNLYPSHHVLTCLVRSLSSATHATANCNPRFIRSLSFGSSSLMVDYRAIPLLAEILRFATSLRSLRISVGEASIPIIIDTLRRHGVSDVPPPSIMTLLKQDLTYIPRALPALENVCVSEPALALIFMRQHALKTLVIENPMMIGDLRTLVPTDSSVRGTNLTRLCLGSVGTFDTPERPFYALGIMYPNLEHLAMRTIVAMAPGLIQVSTTLDVHDRIIPVDIILAYVQVFVVGVYTSRQSARGRRVPRELMEDVCEQDRHARESSCTGEQISTIADPCRTRKRTDGSFRSRG